MNFGVARVVRQWHSFDVNSVFLKRTTLLVVSSVGRGFAHGESLEAHNSARGRKTVAGGFRTVVLKIGSIYGNAHFTASENLRTGEVSLEMFGFGGAEEFFRIGDR